MEPVQEVRHVTAGQNPHSPIYGDDALSKEEKRNLKFDALLKSECTDLGNCLEI